MNERNQKRLPLNPEAQDNAYLIDILRTTVKNEKWNSRTDAKRPCPIAIKVITLTENS